MVSRNLKIYGDPAKLRDLIKRSIKRGNSLLAEAQAVHDVFKVDKARLRPGIKGISLSLSMLNSSWAIDEFKKSVKRWDSGLRQSLTRLLGSQVNAVLKQSLSEISYPDDHGEKTIQQFELLISRRIAELERLLGKIPFTLPDGVVAEKRPFEELRLSGLIEEVQLNEYLRRMSATRTKPQISAAIGAAKELTEAILRSTLNLLSPNVKEPHDFHLLAKEVRRKIDQLSQEQESGIKNAISNLVTGFVTIENALSSLRNSVGTGHGRAHLPKELSRRHALLARDVAFAYTRYIVLTLETLGIIALSEENE